MSNSYAQPVFRTADLTEGLRVVDRLLDMADTHELEVDLDARAPSVQAIRPLLAVCPTADWWTSEEGDIPPEGEVTPQPHFPVRFQSWAMPPDIVRPFLTAVGGFPATLRWDFSGWPAAPEVGLDVGGTRGAFVTLCVNVRDLDLTEPAADHSVFVHVKQVEAERAP
ncbi:hypothetical protein ACIBKX_11880 [Streptomyces sp. NPDC050658]|uniref:hypothetical protein n=1 Tax=unclassified Streptomyces TaxID=2593676 RepID=UPI0034375622